MNQEELKQRLIELIEQPMPMMCGTVTYGEMRMPEYQARFIVNNLIANGVTIRERGEWIPVTERLPESRKFVIVCDEYGHVGEAYFYKQDRKFEWVDDEETAFASHWMPLPEPPEAEKGR